MRSRRRFKVDRDSFNPDGTVKRMPVEVYCARCQVKGHDTCSLMAGCLCCEDTMERLNEMNRGE